MRAVVTGGAGFLASHLIDRLVLENFQVVVIDNLVTGSPENLASHLENGTVRLIEQDVTEYLFLDGPVDWMFHFASPASPADFARMPIQVLKVGALGTHKALGLAKAKKAKFMLASTSEVYGDPVITPQPETYWGNVNSIGPRGVYDEAKRYAEALTMAYHRYHGVDIRIARYFNTYGPRMRLNDGRVVPNFLVQALRGEPLTIYGDGSQTRSFGYIDDIVEATWRLALTPFTEPVNIGTDDEYSVIEFAMLVLEVTRSQSEIIFLPALEDDPRQRRPDLTRCRQVLDGWESKVALRDGLGQTASFFAQSLRVAGH